MEPHISGLSTYDAQHLNNYYQSCYSSYSTYSNSTYNNNIANNNASANFPMKINGYLPGVCNFSTSSLTDLSQNSFIISSTASHIANDNNHNSSATNSLSTMELVNILRNVDSLPSAAHTAKIMNVDIRNNAQHSVFNPYGPPKAKQSRTSLVADSYDNNNNDEICWPTPMNNNLLGTKNFTTYQSSSSSSTSSSLSSVMSGGINMLPTIDLTIPSLADNKLAATANSSISPLVGQMYLQASTAAKATPIKSNGGFLRNGSFDCNLSLLSNSANSEKSFCELPTTLRHNTSQSRMFTLSNDEPVTYTKLGRFVFTHDNKPVRLFFTKALYFSNHHSCDRLHIDGINYTCTEQYYMYYKAFVFGDMTSAKAILATNDPKVIKRIGSSIEGFDQKQWDCVSILVMAIASLRKYEQNPDLRRRLFDTADSELVEASPNDAWWGIGLAIDAFEVRDRRNWRGKNVMGRLLTLLRDRLLRRPEFATEKREVYAKHAQNKI